jgi:hypothetical protein
MTTEAEASAALAARKAIPVNFMFLVLNVAVDVEGAVAI